VKNVVAAKLIQIKTIVLLKIFSGRGMELSELQIFNNKLLSFDDKTGIVFEIIDGKVNPWIILSDGENGFKSEWATIKDNELFVGSHGNEWQKDCSNKRDQSSKNCYPKVFNNKLIKVVSQTGEVKTLNWATNYDNLQKATGFQSPGYIIHEAVIWSFIHKKWFFLPRFCSKEKYNADKEKSAGCNLLIISDEKFENIKVVDIPLRGEYRKIQGFSSFKFVPESNDTMIVALKTTETDSVTNTFATVFDINGHKIYGKIHLFLDKYEGIEFI
jgi:soluble calcium-activated nucleotidase 1